MQPNSLMTATLLAASLLATVPLGACCGDGKGQRSPRKRPGPARAAATPTATEAAVAVGAGAATAAEGDPAAWAAVRAALTIDRNCFGHDERFCPRDPAFLDPIIRRALLEHHKGGMPPANRAERVARHASYDYREAWKGTKAGRQHVEQLLRQHYDAPRVTQHGATLAVDLGHVPGQLSYPQQGKTRRLRFTSELVDDRRLVASEVGRLFTVHAAAHPAAPAIELQVALHVHSTREQLRYRLLRAQAAQGFDAPQALVVIDRDARFGGRYLPLQPGDLARLAAGELSLEHGDLESCPKDQREHCRWGPKRR